MNKNDLQNNTQKIQDWANQTHKKLGWTQLFRKW